LKGEHYRYGICGVYCGQCPGGNGRVKMIAGELKRLVDNDGLASTVTQVLEVDVESAFRGPIVISIQGTRTVVGQGIAVSFSVELENMGMMTETYDLILLANTTVIDTFENITQPGGTLAVLTSVWGTTGVATGIYTISTQVIHHQGETATIRANNLEICVSVLGDVDANFYVDIYDMVLIAGVYGLHNGDSQYNADCDIDGDGDIDIFDIVTAAGNYGESA